MRTSESPPGSAMCQISTKPRMTASSSTRRWLLGSRLGQPEGREDRRQPIPKLTEFGA